MANESRSFRMIGGTTIENIVEAVDTYCRINKSMVTQSSKTVEGYVLQASQPGNGWKTISGTRLAITTQFMVIGDVLTVTVGQGEWADKIGADFCRVHRGDSAELSKSIIVFYAISTKALQTGAFFRGEMGGFAQCLFPLYSVCSDLSIEKSTILPL